MKTRENQLLYWFHPSFSFATEWTHFFPPAAPFQQVLDVRAYMRKDAFAYKRCSNIEHNLNADARSEHMAAARRAGRCEAVQRSGGGAQGSRIPGSQVPPPAFNSVFPSTSSTVTCKLGKIKKDYSARNLTLDLPIHAWKLSLFCMEHFHEKGGVGGVPLHVLEIQEILPSLGHRPENTQRSLRISGFLFGFLSGRRSPENGH